MCLENDLVENKRNNWTPPGKGLRLSRNMEMLGRNED